MSGETGAAHLRFMTAEVDIDERFGAEAQRLARDLNVDYKKLLADNIRKSLYDLKRQRDQKLSVAEKIRRHRESYEKFPVREDEFLLDQSRPHPNSSKRKTWTAKC